MLRSDRRIDLLRRGYLERTLEARLAPLNSLGNLA